ncbi:GAF domain-containing protein [Acuticoccus sp. M5D2P5]|uniref:GAF domain-containing protein n=1 Tax=Acuticoccus kalidii TaxID=2910977 RepID=UPI001F414A74|nr:GAF domain-containing protein [Acuticoccus kalidii]MCF3933142.1 GAF domain-containing protein [Acuticoccus kalidii]
MTDEILAILQSQALPGQPDATFKAMERFTHRLVGHKLFTLLYVDGDEVARCYSNRPDEYPVAGRKPMGKTPWGDHVLAGRAPYLGADKAGIRWAFFDHVQIEGMGLGSVINIPVIYDEAVIGTMNLLDAEHHYKRSDVDLLTPLAPLLIPAFLTARAAAR